MNFSYVLTYKSTDKHDTLLTKTSYSSTDVIMIRILWIPYGRIWRKDEEEDVSSLLDDVKEKRGFWRLKEEALDRSVWGTRFGRDYGPVVHRQQNEWMNEWVNK